jgi:CheY-like chemotaxis protein
MYDRYLQPEGYRVIPATSAEKAVEVAESFLPTLITLDVMAPQYDGWKLLEALKTNPNTADIPVVICSIIEEREKAAALGASDYLVKPILETDLIEVVNRIVNDPVPADRSEAVEPKRVLIVDQDPADIRVLKMLLEEDGLFTIEEAEDGRKSLEILIANSPDALILTSGLPDMDSFTFIKTVRANPSLRSIPIILMVEQDLAPDLEQQLARNCEAVFYKTKLNQEKLLQSLQTATS